MKKIFTLAVLASACLTANADVTTLYIAGTAGIEINGQTLGDWDIVNTLQVPLNRGKFVLDCKNLGTIAISDKSMSSADWGAWATGLWTADITEANVGTPVELKGPGAGNFSAPWKGDWKLEISSDLKTITATTTTPKPEDFYNLVGDGVVGWSATDAYKFVKEGDAYWLDITAEKSFSGKLDNMNILKNADWSAWWGLSVKPLVASNEAGEWAWMANGEGSVLEEGQSYTGTIKLVPPTEAVAGSVCLVTFYPEIIDHNSTSVAVVDAENGAAEYYNLQGVRIGNPEKGQICIVRRGGNVSKTVIK